MTHDPIPAGLVDSVRLSLVEGVGPRLRTELLSAFGSASAALNASPTTLSRLPGISPKVAKRIAAAIETVDAETVIRSAWQHQIDILTSEQEVYPRLLKEIHDPPGVLYCRGTLTAQDPLAITLVGTRQATQYGLRQAERLAASLASAGLTVVSGLARGIDAAAHRGALQAGGRTIAVLAGGLLQIYPPEHQTLSNQVSEQGCLLTEAPPPSATLYRGISTTQPTSQWAVGGDRGDRSSAPLRGFDHRPPCLRAGARGLRASGPRRQPRLARLSCVDSRRRNACRKHRRHH